MVQIIAGKMGKGKTKFLLEKANVAVKECKGSLVYLDKNTKNMHELDNKVRLINVYDYPIRSYNAFIGFLCGIISQDYDLEYLFLDSFLKISKAEDEELAGVLERLDAMGKKYGVSFVVSLSKDEKDLPECAKDMVLLSL